MDAQEIVLEILPRAAGLAIAGYLLLLMYSARAGFLRSTRGLAIAAFVLLVAAFWVLELVEDSLGSRFQPYRTATALSFVVVWTWLSTLVVAFSTAYAEKEPIERLVAWLRERPVNAITISGLLALALIVLCWWLGAEEAEQRSTLGPLVSAFLLGALALDLAMAFSALKSGQLGRLAGSARRGLVLTVLGCVGIPSAQLAFELVPAISLGPDGHDLRAWVMLALLALMAASARTEHFRALVILAEAETARRGGFRAFDIPRGVYLIHDETPETAFELFSELVTLPLRPDAEIPGAEESARAALEYLIPKGLVVTREFPERVRKKHGLQVTPIIWLTETPGEFRVAPTSLALLTDTLIRFMESNPNSIVLLEGIEYIMTFNDFRKVLRSLDSLNEVAWVTKARLLVTVNPKAFDPKELALLERDRNVVVGAAGVEELKRESMVLPHR